ncbi:HNH endonuclease [Streptomyces phage Jay2Jay]|uniref:HNH endonuclease n=2 Tax=Samistivirus jay2jay TaxID=2560786 RepID=A0A221SAT2_9CAUD|nr:HNH endonuclease [Streptomyces phage Jay2Jay]AIW02539.1 HNH endonuclease [Streptomyces phage Jay2Jay]ASN73115.1 HNH endonuclease [Streptomyces phage Warpy]UEM46826.1 HNH endonuclease [Streptomyces phage Targaryen]
MKTDEDRCIEYGVPYDPSITRPVVYAQSNWTCHLCGKRVSKRLKYPHPKSASLDHIVPLSWRKDSPGHVWGNVALAHLRCNQSKGARFAGSTRPAPRRPGFINNVWKLRIALFGFTGAMFYFGATPLALTIAVALCILSVIKVKKSRRRRRRAWWKL